MTCFVVDCGSLATLFANDRFFLMCTENSKINIFLILKRHLQLLGKLLFNVVEIKKIIFFLPLFLLTVIRRAKYFQVLHPETEK